ncbi:Ig-like domain-containing protein [Streptomyces sp. NPDC058279]|uniref:Ig-like domain-containing protein n=1 Tax=Streptomyces sp. NPDC058279 TaxID=3346418 RepID=UPI0036E34C5B
MRHGDGKAVVSFRYGTATTLTADTTTPLFGHPVTLTATVTPANPAAAPTGSVTFFDGTRPLATVPLTDGRASFGTGALRPGPHALTASYGGDAADVASTTEAPADVTVGFSGPCVTANRSGPLTVGADQAVCLSAGARQSGPVTARPGGALAVLDAEITGPVSVDGARALTVCRSRLTGPLAVRDSTGQVLLGSDDDGGADASACGGNRITGPVSLDANAGGVAFQGNQVTGPLRCEGNAPAPRLTDNTVTGPRSGQCR